MADKPCRWLGIIDNDWYRCRHPVMLHHEYFEMAQGHTTFCHGCPCHEPQPDPTPDTCRWTQDEFSNWFSACSGVMPTVTPWDGKAIHGMFCPGCGKRITTQVHDKP